MLQSLQDDSEPFLRQYFGTQYRSLKVLVSFVVHAPGSIREQRSNARLSTKPQANITGSAQSPIVAILPLRDISQSITVTTQEVSRSSVELRHPPTTDNPVDNARTDEIRPGTTESARYPDDRCWLFDILPFATVMPDPI
jgi:hypothetical protein